jgi:hypothetical protein
VKPRALQDHVDWHCFACGRLNEQGLKIKSYRAGSGFACSWQPDPRYVGHPGRLHAGLIATIMMCHMVWAATAQAHSKQGREIRQPIDFTYGTKSFRLELLKPFPLHASVSFRAAVTNIEGERARVICGAHVDDAECARAEADLVRFVPQPAPKAAARE